MPFVSITKPPQGTSTKKSLIDAIIDNLGALNSSVQVGRSENLLNGSFEDDLDAEGIPDNWEVTLLSGGTSAIVGGIHGLYAYKFNFPGGGGNGGGYIQTADFLPVSPNRTVVLSWEQQSTAAGVDNSVEIRWYSSATEGDYISTDVIFADAATNPVVWTTQGGSAVPPSTARFAKIRFIGGNLASIAGSTWFDDVVLYPGTAAIPVMEVISTTQSWTVPSGVTKIRVRAWGAGGGGKSLVGSGTVGGGGGGGYGEAVFDVVPSTVYTATVGAGGAAGTGPGVGSAGGSSSLGVLITSTGGGGGTASVGGAGGTSDGANAFTGQVAAFNAGTAIGGQAAGAGGWGGTSLSAGGVSPGGGGRGRDGNNGAGAGAAGRIIIEY